MQIFHATFFVSQVVSGNPVAAINMIGERAADFIKNDNNDDNNVDISIYDIKIGFESDKIIEEKNN